MKATTSMRVRNVDTVIGIDPDTGRSGFARLDVRTGTLTDVCTLAFPALLETLLALKQSQAKCHILIEAGWLNRSNWHLRWGDSRSAAAAKGVAAGRNHEVGRKLAEMCEHWEIPYALVKPLHKCWSGRDRKITADEFGRVTGWRKRTNQEMRDAALLAWVWAGLQIKI